MGSTRIELEGALNFRDLGGYATGAGITARGKLYRSDALSELTERDRCVLLNLGLTTVVDLRYDREVADRPSAFADHATVRYHHVPVARVGSTELAAHERLLKLDFAAHNVALARESGATFAFLFHLLADEDSYPLVFHCTGGRDRTGVAAALVLTAAGVSRQDIMADYLASNGYLVPLMARMRTSYVARGIDPEPVMRNLHLREAYLNPLLDMLDADVGGIDGYLHAIGVGSEDLTRFKSAFVTVRPEARS